MALKSSVEEGGAFGGKGQKCFDRDGRIRNHAFETSNEILAALPGQESSIQTRSGDAGNNIG